ncbi:MAG TPA: alpha/beta hydrolase [Streptosporangiaceae bacterium]|nr:alpha/beta hydrolase [Streptosporangiaceae bacterium]
MLDPADDALATWLAQVFAWDAGRRDLGSVTCETIAYGDHRDQVADVVRPRAGDSSLSVVSLHGGYFRPQYTRALHMPIARELALQGFSVWNVEYRRYPDAGLAGTTADVRAAVDLVSAQSPPGPVAVLGHSAGGYLAAWVASHPAVDLVVPLAPVTDLVDTVRSGCDNGAVATWLGASPEAAPDLYAAGDLRHRWPTGARQVLVHGVHDATVPIGQSRAYVAAATAAGEQCALRELAGTGHYAFLDPRQPAFRVLLGELNAWRATSSR